MSFTFTCLFLNLYDFLSSVEQKHILRNVSLLNNFVKVFIVSGSQWSLKRFGERWKKYTTSLLEWKYRNNWSNITPLQSCEFQFVLLLYVILTVANEIILKSVRIIKCNNLLCQVNVLFQFHNQLKIINIKHKML